MKEKRYQEKRRIIDSVNNFNNFLFIGLHLKIKTIKNTIFLKSCVVERGYREKRRNESSSG